MNKIFLLVIPCCLLILVNCSTQRPDKFCYTFQEMKDPTIDTLSDWSTIRSKTLMASFVSIDNKYPKSVAPEIDKAIVKHKVTGWKGERLSAQILLWSADNINQIEFEFDDFKSGKEILSSQIAQARFVRYVMTDEFAGGCGYRKPENFAASLAPDMLDSLSCFNLEAKTVRPVWITIDIPSEAKSGSYSGNINLYAKGQKTQCFELEIEVLNKTLPSPSDWQFHLDQWQHPSAVARVHNLKVWSDEHFEAMKPVMQMLANAGQKVITANINKDPWNHQCFDAYEDMIVWNKNIDGTWTYDYTIFDRWVEFMMNIGVRKMINCYSMAPWNNELHYWDVKTQKLITVVAKPGSEEFEEMWGTFLPDFVKHLKQKAWLEITNIAMDERSPEAMEATLSTLEKYAPELGVALADNHKSYKKYPFIKDMCVGVESPVDLEDIEQRRSKGLITTFYVCCSHSFPNQFTFSDSAETTYFGWFTAANNLDGFLRWAYNSWVENPEIDSRFRTWPAGDTYIIYPDARSSIRYERLLEGIQDYEKIQIIKNQLLNSDVDADKTKLSQLNAAISKLGSAERTATWNQDMNAAKELLNKLSE
ncbi:DUF4091 domain-containing protein [Bacteroidales bacterium OttesenSCG-928-M11]|nr:DUF4091 domain-containing protein [Bacteroidales bacterium OttesenSCG-928-M11]